MRLTAVFFANHVEVENHMLNVEGGFWRTTTVPPNSAGFRCSAVVLCDMNPEDVGQQFALHIDAEGPLGHRQSPAHSTKFSLDVPSMFMCISSIVLPIDPGGGRHVYSFRIEGQHERVDVPLAIRVSRS
jgi:hypothetical protein